jgi:hypothetical protein
MQTHTHIPTGDRNEHRYTLVVMQQFIILWMIQDVVINHQIKNTTEKGSNAQSNTSWSTHTHICMETWGAFTVTENEHFESSFGDDRAQPFET